MSGNESHRTHDHEKIRSWVEARNGRPARVKSTRHDDDPGVLRIDFPDYGDDDDLEHISWNDFFRKFEEKKLDFVYQDQAEDGSKSNFNKLVER